MLRTVHSMYAVADEFWKSGTLLVDVDKTPSLTGTRHNIVPSLVSHLLIGNSPSPDDYTYPSNRIVITEWPY